MTIEIKSKTGIPLARYVDAKFRHNAAEAKATVWNDNGQAELEWVDKITDTEFEGELQPMGLFVKIIIE